MLASLGLQGPMQMIDENGPKVELYQQPAPGLGTTEHTVSTLPADDALLQMFGAMMMGAFFGMLIGYVIGAVLLMTLFRNTGNSRPWTAWVPLLNTVELYRTVGIARPWMWTLVLFGGTLLGGWVPVLGWVLSAALLVLSVLITVWMAQGVQRGLGLVSVPATVVAVLLPLVWLIWMVVRSKKAEIQWDPVAAQLQGSTFPLNVWLDKRANK